MDFMFGPKTDGRHLSDLSLLEENQKVKISMKMNKKMAWAVAGLLFILGCAHMPQPCDPEFLASQQMITAAACRTNAEKVCPGYSRMTEDEKLQCPGVLECLDKIEKAEADCHGD